MTSGGLQALHGLGGSIWENIGMVNWLTTGAMSVHGEPLRGLEGVVKFQIIGDIQALVPL